MSEPFGIIDQTAARRWELRVDGELAGLLNYRVSDDRISFVHIEIYPRFEGRGYANALTRAALDATIGRGLAIDPQCPFVREFVHEHPEYQAHLAGA